MKLTLRQRLFVAFSCLAILAASGGLLAIWRLHHLSQRYQQEQEETAAHETVHDYRIALYELANLINLARHDTHSPDAQLFTRRLRWIRNVTQTCTACHRGSDEIRHFSTYLDAIEDQAAVVLASPAHLEPAPSEASQQFRRNIAAIDVSLQHLEERYHRRLERRRQRGRELMRPYLEELLPLAVGALLISLIFAYWLARTTSRPIMDLLATARHAAQGKPHHALSARRDPDLARIALALDELRELSAERARQDVTSHLYNRVVTSQEEERKRLARDLHDGLAQSISALHMDVRAQAEGGDCDPRALLKIADALRTLLDEVRRMARGLRPALLDEKGLGVALARYAQEMQRTYELEVDFESIGPAHTPQRLSSAIETVLYRIAQEALHNVVRHAQAQHVSLVLVQRPRDIKLLIEDDGQGFDVVQALSAGSSLGLLGMRERMDLVGGVLNIESTPGHGTLLRAQVSLAEEET